LPATQQGEQVENWLAVNPLPGMILWIMLYISDYYMTIYTARGYREMEYIKFEGSFELTPQYQKDVDALNPISRLHIKLLVFYTLVILLLWWFFASLLHLAWAYLLYLGMFLLLEVAVHLRHLRNGYMIREIKKNGGSTGQITYQKWFSYKSSAFEFYMFGGLFLLVCLLTFSPFFLGGALMCFGIGFKHMRLAKKAKSTPAQEIQTTHEPTL
jgi:hypothetical protein